MVSEYSNGGDRKPPTLIRSAKGEFATRAIALAAAERQAFDFEPPDPFSPQGRSIYRDGAGFLTVIEGAMSTFHFTTRVVQIVGKA